MFTLLLLLMSPAFIVVFSKAQASFLYSLVCVYLAEAEFSQCGPFSAALEWQRPLLLLCFCQLQMFFQLFLTIFCLWKKKIYACEPAFANLRDRSFSHDLWYLCKNKMISSSKEFKTEINTTYGSYNILYTSQSFQMCVYE